MLLLADFTSVCYTLIDKSEVSGLEGDSAFFTESGKKRALEKRRREKALEWMA